MRDANNGFRSAVLCVSGWLVKNTAMRQDDEDDEFFGSTDALSGMDLGRLRK